MVKFIGDVHGKFSQYAKIIAEHKDTIQVGDMRIGFRRYPHGEPSQNPPYDKMVASNAWFIRGNHDNPWTCKKHTQWIADGIVMDIAGRKTMFVGGGLSIDKEYRIEDYSWWPEEELSQADMWKIAGIYEAVKPEVMVTHECPISAITLIPHTHHFTDNSRTSQFLESLWNIHKPKLWVHGHHHISSDKILEGTRFVCLAELEMKEL